MVLYTLGTGHYISSGGGRIFVATTEHLRVPPLQCGFDSPTMTVEDFMILPLLSQSPQRARVAICMQVTSVLILMSHQPWTTTSHIWSSDMNWILCQWKHSLERLWWRVTLIIQIVENKFIVAIVLLTVEFFLMFSSSSDSPSLSSMAPDDSSVFTDSLMCR